MTDQKETYSNPATINDVAAECGVSKGTVSHFISGRVPVSPKTRARIEAAMKKLDYHPAQTARSLNSRKRLAMNRDFTSGNFPRLTTIGYVSVDVVATVSRLPDREERLVSSGIQTFIGGVAANVASIAAGIGAPLSLNASILTVVGHDQDSDWALSVLADRHVSVLQAPHPDGGRMTRAIIFVEEDGRHTIVNEPIALADVDVQEFIERANVTTQPWCVHLEGYVVAAQIDVVGAARKKGMITSIHSAGLDETWLAENIDLVLSLFDYVVLSREALAGATGTVDQRNGLLALHTRRASMPVSPKVIVVTMGAAGALVLQQDGTLQRVRAPEVTVRDTTGAGDSFVGAFLTVMLHGGDPFTAAQYGCLSGSLTVTGLGAAEIRPTAQNLRDLAERHAIALPDVLAKIPEIPQQSSF
ncbi:LacI family DNA-binding transcriptional regulator [Agrobacterium genomosp. 3]|uniref:carbohydrate kinase family protein n=1 Tax=Agrobacterium tomkonis TaxID=1183410 RepID=UPI001CD901BE|nr:LacI family DNA-binding transcriptional regulator [Agrobacterium tomkonis]MCA1879261.1 LacI family DNA-binding transcriptional regulator [Agrobacterium tumefaciens]MCA1894424.1 LacI family DNA-binding transcriptional regulator [Agrobacterium tomkonis]